MRRPGKHLKPSGSQVFNSITKQKKLRRETAFLLSRYPIGNHHEDLAKSNNSTSKLLEDLADTSRSISNCHGDLETSI
jgi:hypothetical protein